MAKSGTRLLERNEALSSREKRYLISASMLGYIAAGETAKAREIWNTQAEGFLDVQNLDGYMKLLAGIAIGSAGDENLQAKR
jgi:hypothetical protein